MTRTITLKELRPRLPKVIEEIDSRMDRFIVTKRGKPAALMMSIDDYESMLETLSVCMDRKLVKRLKAAEKEVKSGKARSLDEIEKELGLA